MDITPGGLHKNLKDWSWEHSGSYKLKQPEAEVVINVLERFRPKVVIDVNRGDWVHSECPGCGKTVESSHLYCPNCGQRLERRRHEPNDSKEDL